MTDPLVDHSLIDPLAGTVGYEAVSETVPAFDDFPVAVLQDLFEVM